MMFGLKFDSDRKLKMSESPRVGQDSSTRNLQEQDSWNRTVLRESASDGSSSIHPTSSVVVKDFRSSVF